MKLARFLPVLLLFFGETSAIGGDPYVEVARIGGKSYYTGPIARVSFDDDLQDFFCKSFLKRKDPHADGLTMDGYSYSRSPELLIYDGFVPSFRYGDHTPLHVHISHVGVSMDRSIPKDEIDRIRALAREAVLESYGELIQPEIRALVDEVESELNPKMLSFWVVKKEDKIVGVVRMARAEVRGGKVFLPGLAIMRKRGLMTPEHEEQVSRALKGNAPAGKIGYLDKAGKEIGQFYIDKSLSSGEREAVRKRLLLGIASGEKRELWEEEETVVFNHTSRPGHFRLWSEGYGFSDKIVEAEKDGIHEIMATTNEDELRQRILSILSLP